MLARRAHTSSERRADRGGYPSSLACERQHAAARSVAASLLMHQRCQLACHMPQERPTCHMATQVLLLLAS